MPNWIFYKDAHPDFYDRDRALKILIEAHVDLKERWIEYIKATYENYLQERIDYVDIAEIARHVTDRVRVKNTNDFHLIFDKVEEILLNCSSDVEDLIVVGLFEGIQNLCGGEKINYWTGFDKWLKPTSKQKWDQLIFDWEGKDAIERFKIENPGNNKLL